VPKRPGGSRAGRGLPDVAAVADPATGYLIRVAGVDIGVGGTSGGAPLWAGLLCRCAQLLETKLGLLQPAIYHDALARREAPGFRAITEGDNGGYHAGPGWNACAGLGVPRGEALLAVLRKHLAARTSPHPAAS
jgi:kumamolisin